MYRLFVGILGLLSISCFVLACYYIFKGDVMRTGIFAGMAGGMYWVAKILERNTRYM